MASIKLKGDTSGEVTISAPSVAGTTTLELPATSSTLATQNSLGVRNLIINGDMRIAQRGTSATGLTGAAYNTVDRFYNNIAAAGTWTSSQDTDVPTGQGFANSHKLTCTTANASAVVLATMYKMEGQMLQHLKKGTANAESLTLSFWVKSNKTGTYIIELYDVDNTRQISKSYTVSSADTWEKKTITIEGDTTGTLDNDNGRSLELYFWLAASSTFAGGTLNTSWASAVNANRAVGVVNLADTIGNYINITGVQLEVGTEATPFEHRPYDMELARCQRYYYRNSADSNYMSYASGRANSTTVGVFTYNHPVTMRALPTYTQSGTGVNTPSQITITSLGTSYAGKNSSFVAVNVASGLTAGNGLLWNSNNNTTSYVEADAEL